MKKTLLIPLLVLSLAAMACSLFVPNSSKSPAESSQSTQPALLATTQPAATRAPTQARPTRPVPTSLPVTSDQPVEIRGEFTFSNAIITTYYVEHAVALVDMYGFVTRDEEWEIPISSQTLGYLDLDPQAQTGSYSLQLPARPTGVQADVNPDGQDETGVQIFVVAYFPNLTGDPYSVGDDRSLGWPSYLTSAKNDSENDDEVIGGSLVVWSPDDQQFFPSEFGADGRLFTDDDPVAALPAGYSVINLDEKPFVIQRDALPELTLYEPLDVAVKDFSGLSYTEAFEQTFNILRKEYAFNGIEGKQPNWDALYADLSPRFAEAEQQSDEEGFYRTMRDFALAFKDGHVNLGGGEVEQRLFTQETEGGYGFAVRELDDGSLVVVYVLEEGPAANTGMQVGAEVLEFNGQPIAEAISAVKPWSAPHSTDFGLRYQQARYLLRAPLGTPATITFANENGQPETIELEAVNERNSFSVTSTFLGFDPNALPVEFDILPPGIGYIKISSNYDDLNLIIRLFERALQTLEANSIPGIIIDMRQNSGGANLGLAGFLTNQEIQLGQLSYYSESTGQFEPKGLPDRVLPNVNQYRFDKMVLMVDQACASACELEAYGFSQVPVMTIVGQYPSAGIEAEVARGQFLLPDDMSLQVPTGRFTLPDGSLFLEGTGVQPTVRIPITRELVLAEGDPILDQAIELAQ